MNNRIKIKLNFLMLVFLFVNALLNSNNFIYGNTVVKKDIDKDFQDSNQSYKTYRARGILSSKEKKPAKEHKPKKNVLKDADEFEKKEIKQKIDKSKSTYFQNQFVSFQLNYNRSFYYRNDSNNSKEISDTKITTVDFSISYLTKINKLLFQFGIFNGQVVSLQKNNQLSSGSVCSIDFDKNCKRTGILIAALYQLPLNKIFQVFNKSHFIYAGLNYNLFRTSSLTFQGEPLFNSHFQAGFIGISILYMYYLNEKIIPTFQIQTGYQHFFSQPSMKKLNSSIFVDDVIYYSGWNYAFSVGLSFKL